jgi:PAS domain S-box-containing protein
MTSSRDITERKQAEKALQESEKKFRTLVDQAAQMLFLHDDEGHIIDVNQKTVAQLGYTREELLQMHVFDLDPDADQRDDKNWLWKNWPTGGEAITFETRQRRKDGSIYPAEVTASKIVLNDTTYVLSLVQDITERKQFEKALIDNEMKFRDLAETLQLTDRRKDKFLAILSHEIRNPLAAMRMALSLFEQDSLDGEQAKKAKEILNRQVTHLSSLIDDLLDIPRITQNKIVLQKKQLELNELVTKTIKSFQFLFQEKGIQLEIKLAPTCLYVEADEIRLTQVVENLLHNAAKFTANNGITQVTIFKDNLQQNAIIQVKDSGIGMEPEMLSHIFEPFIQADTSLDRSASGLGLGLALVKDLVELHDGKVTAHSEGLGKGSEFIVSLPLVSTVQAEQVAS